MLKWAGLIVSVLISNNVFAAVKLTVPQEIVVLAINQKEINSGFFRTQKNYDLEAGQTTLHVRYQQYFDHRNGQHDILKSGVIEINTDNLEDNKTYHLKLVNAPKSFEEAQQFEQYPVIALLDQNNRIIVQQDGVNFKTKSMFENVFQKDDDSIKKSRDVKNQNNSDLISSENSANKKYLKSKDQEMIEIWKSATKQERQKFMAWLAEQ